MLILVDNIIFFGKVLMANKRCYFKVSDKNIFHAHVELSKKLLLCFGSGKYLTVSKKMFSGRKSAELN